MITEDSPNVAFDESFPEPKSSPSVEDDRIIEPVVKDLVRSSLLEANASDLGYPKNVKEVRGHPIEQVLGELKIKAKKQLPITVGYMLYSIEAKVPFNFAYFVAKRMNYFNDEAIPYARIITMIFEYIQNQHPNDESRMIEVDDVFPTYTPFTIDSLVDSIS
ncbi:hypothetical protein Tco_0580263 [Tanacetum coccineum]